MARPFRERNPIAVGAVSVAVLTVAMLFAFSLDRFTFLRGVYVVHADFADAAGLTPENEVRVAGLKVGKVRAIELAGPAPDSSAAALGLQAQPGDGPGEPAVRDRVRVTMEIANDVRLGTASTAEIKLKTLLGSKFLDISPRGGAPFLEAGDVIPLSRTIVPFEIYQATNRTVGTIGALDAQALNDMFRELATITDDPEGNLGRLLDGLAKATAALSDRDAELESLLRGADEVAGVLSARSEELGRIIDAGARLLGELAERRGALKDFVRGTDRVAAELSDLLASTRTDLDPALRDLHELLLVVADNLDPVQAALRGLGAGAESFGRVFTNGTWGEVWLASALGLPLPPGVPISDLIPAGGNAYRSIYGVDG